MREPLEHHRSVTDGPVQGKRVLWEENTAENPQPPASLRTLTGVRGHSQPRSLRASPRPLHSTPSPLTEAPVFHGSARGTRVLCAHCSWANTTQHVDLLQSVRTLPRAAPTLTAGPCGPSSPRGGWKAGTGVLGASMRECWALGGPHASCPLPVEQRCPTWRPCLPTSLVATRPLPLSLQCARFPKASLVRCPCAGTHQTAGCL